jgi:inward rectifier potassium channel
MKNQPRPRVVRFGTREIVSTGLPFNFWGDLSHLSMTARWPVFVGGALAVFITVNCLFAAIYWLADVLGNAPVANADGTFLNYLYFSVETLTTVGYGDMHPRTHFAHIVASLELFAGVFMTAVITGLVFFRFSRARARILFAAAAPIATHDGRPSLMIRLANERMNAISVAQARLWMMQTYVTAEGSLFRRFEELPLLRDQSPLFTLSWTVMHPIDESSPLYGLSQQDLLDRDVTIMAIVEGHDETTGQSVRARKTYATEDIRFGHRYADILDVQNGERTVINYVRFHDTETE